jgi:hypothetical protein
MPVPQNDLQNVTTNNGELFDSAAANFFRKRNVCGFECEKGFESNIY